MTTVTIDLSTYGVTFHEDAQTAAKHAEDHDQFAVFSKDDLNELTSSQQVALYNATVTQLNNATPSLGLQPTKRFSTKDAGTKRIMANLQDLWDNHRQGAFSKVKERKAAAKKAAQPRTVTPGKEQWRRAKHVEPEAVGYRPKPGSVQDGMYKILTASADGVTMEDFCKQCSELDTKDAGLYNPPQVWGSLRYLFVSLRGYGLSFDGERFKLLIPKDERAHGSEKE